MMSTPLYKVRHLASSTGWQLRLSGDQNWVPVAAWANVEVKIGGDVMEVILPCIACRDGCLEPTDLAEEIREVEHERR